jgi:NADH-quinone oxidoreductase subunit H
MKILFSYFIFPGLLFGVTIGLFSGWIDRKITARIHWRVGPPWHQNFTDILKLFGKETILPEGAGKVFLWAPYLGFLSLGLAAAIIGSAVYFYQEGFSGDLIVLVYLLMIPAVSLIIGASSCGNPLASVGVSREMKLMLAYELPFLLSLVTVIIKSAGSVKISQILLHQQNFGANTASFSGMIAFIVAILCMQAKLGFVPFDAAEAEQEIMGGVLIEYSGLPLAIFKLTKALMLYTMPIFLISLFWGKNLSPLPLAGKYISLLAVIVLIKNTNPRLRIDQALRFFWGSVTVLAITAVGLALIGR